jgi:hypothetical protein
MLLRRIVWYKFTDVSEMPAASALMMEAANTSEMSSNLYTLNNPEDSHFHTPSRENLISHYTVSL